MHNPLPSAIAGPGKTRNYIAYATGLLTVSQDARGCLLPVPNGFLKDGALVVH